jgi:hypothetical protein
LEQDRPPTPKRLTADGQRASCFLAKSSMRLTAMLLGVAMASAGVPQALAQTSVQVPTQAQVTEKATDKAPQSVRFLSAGMLHERLFSDDPYAREAGRHYVLGVLDALAFRRDARVCLGPDVEANELIMVVMRHLASRPDMHRYNAASFVREAIATEFPCV